MNSKLEKTVITHELELIHPGDSEANQIPIELIQKTDEDGNPIEYYTWVDSVICKDETCDVVKVKLIWNAIGQYQRFELKKGSKLTKLDHVPFNAEDHAKLQRILLDKNSPLSEATKEAMTTNKSKAAEDGIAGATLLTLSTNVVVGAGYTCYDLWHWANGELVDIIKDISAKSMTKNKLLENLNSSDPELLKFTFLALKSQKYINSKIKDKMLICLKTGDKSIIGAAYDYLESVENEANFKSTLIKIFAIVNNEKRVYISTKLNASKINDKQFYGKLSDVLPAMKTHYEVQLFLKMIDAKKLWNKTIINNTLKLLNHPRKLASFVSQQA